MHPELRTARALHHQWRHLPEAERTHIEPLARDVKELALDLRGRVDVDAAAVDLATANAVLDSALRAAVMPRAA